MATQTRATPAKGPEPPNRRLRTRLETAGDVRKELGRLYRAARAGLLDVQDASRLANVLAILGRMIEAGDLEARIEALEASQPRQNGAERIGGTPSWPAH